MRSPARPRARLAVVVLAALVGAAASASAADPTIAKVRSGKPGSKYLYVMFKTPAPAPADVRGKNRWEVQVATANALTPIDVVDAQEVADDYAVTGLVMITLATPLPSDYKRVEVRYRSGSAPLGILTPSKAPPSGIVPVDDPKKADVYLSGILLPAAEAKPLYTIDSRGTYELWASASGARVWEVTGSAKGDKRPNADLDSYVVGANYHQIGRVGGVDLHWFSGTEMNAKARVTNVVTAPRLVKPWTRNIFRTDSDGATTLAATFGLTLDGAIETGWNLRNLYTDPDDDQEGKGSGGIFRVVPGITVYAVKPDGGFFHRIGVTARYAVRLLARDEIFLETRKSQGVVKDPIPLLDRRARHFAQITGAFMLTEFAGVELKYTYGSEPPAFKFVDHSGSVGLVIKFRQTGRVR